ncbi:sensor histidine kinase [Streptomyces sennicomposti]
MTPLDRARCGLRAHPFALDAALAAAVLVCMVAGSFVDPNEAGGVSWAVRRPEVLSLVLMTLGAVALVFRRRAPRTVLAVTGAVSLIECVTGDPRAPVAMSVVVALFTVAASTDRTTTWRLGLSTMVVLTGAAMLAGPLPWYAQENLGIFAWTGMAAAGGDAVRSRRAFVRAMRERAERAERTREEEARRRVAEERLRIARDLHDVVAHHIALVNVQAGVAAHVMDKRPDQAKEALAHVREAGRSALNELRATVGLLRQSDDPEAPTEPAPGLDRLDELVGTFRSAGLHVEVARADGGTTLPAAVDLAAFRVVQEALTNVHKHAGTGARAEVSVVRVGPRIEITVLDDGARGTTRPAPGTLRPAPGADGRAPAAATAAPEALETPEGTPAADTPAPTGGHGLLGMRERVTALGGALTTGPRYGGGFRVHAILPATTHTPPPTSLRTQPHAQARTPAPGDAV